MSQSTPQDTLPPDVADAVTAAAAAGSAEAIRPRHEPIWAGDYGYLDPETREFIVVRPDTPRPWLNALTNGRFFATVSSVGGGDVWLGDRLQGRLVAGRVAEFPLGAAGWAFYVRHRDTGEFWSMLPHPACGEPGHLECRHGLGMTAFTTTRRDMIARLMVYVPRRHDALVWTIILSNLGAKPLPLDVWAVVALEDGPPRETLFDATGPVLMALARREPESDAGDASVFLASNGPVQGFDTDADYAIGRWRTEANPATVEMAQSFQSESSGASNCLCLRLHPIVPARGGTRFEVAFGAASGPGGGGMADAARALGFAEELKKKNTADAWRDDVHHTIVDQLLAGCQVELPDGPVELTANTWGAWQVHVAGLATDAGDPASTLQAVAGTLGGDAAEGFALIHRHVEACATGGFIGGRDLVWLLHAADEAMSEAGEAARAGVLETWRLLGGSIGAAVTSLDESGVVAMGGQADLVTSMQFAWALEKAARLASTAGHAEDARHCASTRERLVESIGDLGWTGQWYRDRADLGGAAPVSDDAAASPLDLPRVSLDAQSWAVLSGVANDERGAGAMDAAYDRLATEQGPQSLDPPYGSAVRGRRESLQPPGHGANGGVVTRSVAWAIMADARVGRTERALDAFRRATPLLGSNPVEVHAREPFLVAAAVAGPSSPLAGRAEGLPWFGEGAYWLRHALIAHLLGIRSEYNGLRVDPRIPASWRAFVVRRRFRGAYYQVFVTNPDGHVHGLRELLVDGKRVGGSLIPSFSDTTTHEVQARM